ncbi:hypothetical protein L7F22_011291 [Adiantum nelumboides]|nr:hypothetical protein [Adiantum nelumboides]
MQRRTVCIKKDDSSYVCAELVWPELAVESAPSKVVHVQKGLMVLQNHFGSGCHVGAWEDQIQDFLKTETIWLAIVYVKVGRIPFTFLEDVRSRFLKAYGRMCRTALAYAMNDEFSRVLAHQMEYFSNDPSADSINRMKGEINQVRYVMLENIDKVLERGDRLELLSDKTSNIQNRAFRFRKQARRFRGTMCWRNVKLMCSLIFLLLVVAYIGLAVYCDGVTLPTCR